MSPKARFSDTSPTPWRLEDHPDLGRQILDANDHIITHAHAQYEQGAPDPDDMELIVAAVNAFTRGRP